MKTILFEISILFIVKTVDQKVRPDKRWLVVGIKKFLKNITLLKALNDDKWKLDNLYFK